MKHVDEEIKAQGHNDEHRHYSRHCPHIDNPPPLSRVEQAAGSVDCPLSLSHWGRGRAKGAVRQRARPLVPLCPPAGTQLPRAWCHSGRTWPNSKSKHRFWIQDSFKPQVRTATVWHRAAQGAPPRLPHSRRRGLRTLGPPLGLQLGSLPGRLVSCSQGGDIWEGLLQGPHWVHGSQSLRTHLPLLPGTISFLFVT